mgnify:CR=1 FL=1
MAMLIAVTLFGLFRNLYGFLAPEQPPQRGLMVIEGWMHDFALDEAVRMYRAGDYSKIISTGVPIETGSYIQSFKTYSEMTTARLLKLGVDSSEIITAIGAEAQTDRTYEAAQALRHYIMAYNLTEKDIHLVTTGPHGRRSHLLFRKALGKEYHIGVTCLDKSSYNAKDWYKSSEGVRSVIGELIAYTYAKFFFFP